MALPEPDQGWPAHDRPASGPATVLLDGHAPPALLGGKGSALDRLVAWGLPVPPSAVVTTDAYVRFASHPQIDELLRRIRAGEDVDADHVDAVFARVPFDRDDADAIRATAARVGGDGLLAVRSSATVEDLERSSFAGQYRSILEVDASDGDAVLAAVRAVFASLWHPAPRAYRRAFGIDDESAAMAVVLMRMVPARRAGVVFTIDPGGDRARARVEAVEGLAEALVSGAATPDAVLVAREGDRELVPPEIEEAVDLSLHIEELDGRPQDVEWAWDGERVWIVQARPITVVDREEGDGFDDPPEEIEDADLTTAGIGEMLPGVLPPLVWSVAAPMVEEAFRRLLSDLGVMPDDVTGPRAFVHRVRGRAVMDFSQLQSMAGALPGSAGEDLEAEYFGSRRRGREAAPAGPSTTGRLRSAVHDLRVLRSRHWAEREVAIVVGAIHAVLADRPEISALPTSELLSYHLRLLDLAARSVAAELAVAADAAATYRRLQVMLSRHFDPVRCGRLADRAVAKAGRAVAVTPDASAAVFAGPTWREIGRDPPPARPDDDSDVHDFESVARELQACAGWKPDSPVARLRMRAMRRLAAEATDRLRARERSKSAILELGGEVRRVHLELGRRLVEAGVVDAAADVDLLTPAEIRSALLDAMPVAGDVIARRRRARSTYESQGALPPRFTGTPEVIEAVRDGTDCMEGWGASAGRFRGVAQVVRNPTDRLEPGAVLVAEATDPSWAPLFLEAGAIVLDRGGPLSHAAILAREIGVPAVLNVPGATRWLDGHEITVDGDAGIVVVHDGATDAR